MNVVLTTHYYSPEEQKGLLIVENFNKKSNVYNHLDYLNKQKFIVLKNKYGLPIVEETDLYGLTTRQVCTGAEYIQIIFKEYMQIGEGQAYEENEGQAFNEFLPNLEEIDPNKIYLAELVNKNVIEVKSSKDVYDYIQKKSTFEIKLGNADSYRGSKEYLHSLELAIGSSKDGVLNQSILKVSDPTGRSLLSGFYSENHIRDLINRRNYLLNVGISVNYSYENCVFDVFTHVGEPAIKTIRLAELEGNIGFKR